ncbi:hypothetical protein C1H46_041911 [Malus baccata]|uniref:Uncharacterized protein n=1 Tax=Malus baccata TaxID=106549 RepID=A0A540KE97_MALBA|nr:hypothetical protein C1H46_041911 [Malus baccata]
MQRIANIDGLRMWCYNDEGQQVDATSWTQVSRWVLRQCEAAGDVGESGAVATWVFEKSMAKPKHDGSCGITG